MRDFSTVIPGWDDVQQRDVQDFDCGGADSPINRQVNGLINRSELLKLISNLVVLSATTDAPTGTEAVGSAYIVPHTGATGAFASQADKVAFLTLAGNWVFLTPVLGWQALVADQNNAKLAFNGTTWGAPGGTEYTSNAVSGTVTVPANTKTVVLTGNATIATLTLDLTAVKGSAADVVIFPNGPTAVTALTIAGAAVVGGLTALVAATPVVLRWSGALNGFINIT